MCSRDKQRAVRKRPHMLALKVAETWPVCTVCNGWVMLLVCMGKTRFGGIIWGEVVVMHAQKFPISTYYLSVPSNLPEGFALHSSGASSDARCLRKADVSGQSQRIQTCLFLIPFVSYKKKPTVHKGPLDLAVG